MRWKPEQLANPEKIEADKLLMDYGRSIASITRKFIGEIQWQDRLEAWIQEAAIYPMGIIKLYFERETTNEPVTDGKRVEQDGQDQIARIKQLSADIAENRIQANDPQVIELNDLLTGLGQKAEIDIREGLVVQSVPLGNFRLPRGITILEDVYLVPWMSQDVMLAKKAIRKRFPFKWNEDGESWTGVHPDDLVEAAAVKPGASRKDQIKDLRKTSSRAAKSDARADENTELLVREIWDRESGNVVVFVEGVSYPVAKWKPTKVPEQWFPFHILVLNRLPNQVAGIGGVELMMDEQARINRKRTDEEMARWHSLPKGIVDSNFFKEEDQNKLVGLTPFKLKGINLGGKNINEMIQWTSTTVDPRAFDTSQDRQDLQRAGNVSSQSLGVTGEAEFAAEVEAANAGTAISSQANKNRCRRALERFYDATAQVLQQEVGRGQALELDPTVVWPTVYTDAEAETMYETIRKEVRAGLLPEMAQQAMAGGGATFNPKELQRQVEQAAEPLVEKRCLEEFGVPKPLSRQGLYRRLRVKVIVAMDAAIDRNQRMRTMMKIFEGLAAMVTACAAAGFRVDPMPFLKQAAHLFEADEDLVEEMFHPDTNATAALLLQAMATGGDEIDPQTAMGLIQALQPTVEAAMVAAANGEKPAQAGGGAPAPAPAPAMPAAAPAEAPLEPALNAAE